MSATLVDRTVPPGAEIPPAVVATEVTRRFGEAKTAVDALRGVSLAVSRGEVVGIMGPSGSGKSTLLHILAGLDRPTSGEVSIGGRALSRLRDRDLTLLRRSQVGFVFQFFNLLPMLTAEANIVLPPRRSPAPACGPAPCTSSTATRP
jgi:putative ABC transport system ATP-binding protein